MSAERAPLRAALAVGLVAGGFTVATLHAAACYAVAAGQARLGRWP
jgi:hypothetical protein